MRRFISILLLICILMQSSFYLGCATALNEELTYLREDETFEEKKEPRNVFFVMESDIILEGKILFVRKNSVLIETPEKIDNESKEINGKFVTNIRINQIESIMVQGQSNMGLFSKYGGWITAFGITTIFCIASGHKSSDETERIDDGGLWIVFVPVVAGFSWIFGSFVGMLVGVGTSKFDEEYQMSKIKQRSTLRKYARYPKNEPDILRIVFPNNSDNNQDISE